MLLSENNVNRNECQKLSVLDKKQIDNTFHGLSLVDHRNIVPFNVYFADFSAKQPMKSTLQKGEESDMCTTICGTT